MLIAMLTAIGAAIGPVLLRMGIALISKAVVEEALIDLIGFALSMYKSHAAKTEDPLDDERAKRLELIYNTWKDALGRIDAKGG